jgi:hypothetical protein
MSEQSGALVRCCGQRFATLDAAKENADNVRRVKDRCTEEMHRALFAKDLSTGASTNGEGSDVVGL